MQTQHCIDTIAPARIGRRHAIGIFVAVRKTVSDAVVRVVDTLLVWQERARQRHQLASLDTHALKDVGLDPAAAAREAEKPFWRP